MHDFFRFGYAVLASLAISVFTVGCSKSPAPLDAQLSIDEQGGYTLNGKQVVESELKHEMKLLRSVGSAVRLEIYAHPMARYDAVGKAVKAAQDSGVDNLAFVTTPPVSSAYSAPTPK